MNNNTILDYWEGVSDDDTSILLRYFYQDSDAQLAAVLLRQAAIPSFITSSNSQTILPTGQGWIGLHVRKIDGASAVDILREADMWEADKEISEEVQSKQMYFIMAVLAILILGGYVLSLLGYFM